MLATRWPELFAERGWVFELKWDGVRCLLHWDGERPILRSRTGIDATPRYPELEMFQAERPLVLDGEIVALDGSGRPSFELLQQRMNLGSASLVAHARVEVPVSYVVFDILYDDGDVTSEPLEQRQDRLRALDLAGPMTVPEVVDEDPGPLWDFVVERGIEGIVGKRLGSIYRPGERSADWRKIGAFKQARALVGGFTRGEGARSDAFGALLLGQWAPDGLRWVGSVGSGFSDSALRAIRSALDEMALDESPFRPTEGMPRDVTWVQPVLVALVQYKEWTSVGRLRAPSFKGFTDDPIGAVTWEREGPGADG